jgi:hypothetical protein
MDANANLWATAYSDLGFPGMMLFSLLLGAILNLFDTLTGDLDLGFACMLIVFPSMILANSGLLTSLLTQGIGLLLIMVILVPRAWFQHQSSKPLHEKKAAA